MKPQRIRDPIHNLIQFNADDFEQTCWKVLNTSAMQRLRRIKQLGFSEFTYPGATHTRFAHSVGVFHTARQLGSVVKEQLGNDKYDGRKARLVMAAALVHDIGHGPFSHAFEDALQSLGKGKRHEDRATQILLETELRDAFKEFPDFPKEISSILSCRYPTDIYSSLIASQFDADRLDYMRRDRLMTGTQQSAIDYDWLLANLRVRKIPIQTDEMKTGEAEALVIDEKSRVAVEGYIFSLFYLYVNVYYHKATRGIEKLFTSLICLIATRIAEGDSACVPLPRTHPLLRFLHDPSDIQNFLALDDSVVLGSLCMLGDSSDQVIAELALRIRNRRLYKCVDVSKLMIAKFGLPQPGVASRDKDVTRVREAARRIARMSELATERGLFEPSSDGSRRILEDTAPRNAYKREDGKPFSYIYVVGPDDQLYDISDLSPAVNSLGDFRAYRLYGRDDSDIDKIHKLIEEVSNESGNS